MYHPAPRSPSGGLPRESIPGRLPAALDHRSVPALRNAVHGAATPAGAPASRWLQPGVIPAEILLGNVALLFTLPVLAGGALVPALWLIDATLAVGLVAAFGRTGTGAGRRLITALASLAVAALFDWYAVWVASTDATAFAVVLAFAAPLLALGVGVGSGVRAGHAGDAAALPGGPANPATTLAHEGRGPLLEDAGRSGAANGAYGQAP